MPKVIFSLFVLYILFHTLILRFFKLPTFMLQLLINTYDRITSNLAYRVNSIKYELWSISYGMKKTEKAYFLKLLGLFYYIQSYNLYSVAFIASLLFYILCCNNKCLFFIIPLTFRFSIHINLGFRFTISDMV